MSLLHNIIESIDNLESLFETIPVERKELLRELADYIKRKTTDSQEVNLTFICTHNSRRSIMSQIWAQAAAEYYGIGNVHCYSGGTEATAFNPRAVKAMKEAGFQIEKREASDNPVYIVKYSDNAQPIQCFSKVYNDPFNPQSNFAAIMTCSDADKNCPVVLGADARFPIRYDDPKEFDETPLEAVKYLERSKQIAVEILYAFSKIN